MLLAVILVSLPYLGLSPDDGAMIIGVLVLGGIVLFQLGDLKEPTKRNYKRARRLVIGSRPPKTADLPTFYPSRTDFTVVLTGRKLIQGGTVLSLDDDVGDFTTGDVFIEGDKIVAVGSGLVAGEAEVIDASGMIVMPGFIDTHRHIWEGLLRNIGTDVPLEGRTSCMTRCSTSWHQRFDRRRVRRQSGLRPWRNKRQHHDASRLVACPRFTSPHRRGDPGFDDSGLRAVSAYGFPWWGKWEEREPSWFVGAATEHFSTKDQMLTLALAGPGPEFTDFEVSRDHWKLARETEARITTHVGVEPQTDGTLGCPGVGNLIRLADGLPCSRAARLRSLALRMWWDRREPGMRSPESEFAWWR